MTPVVFSKRARNGRLGIGDFIAQDNPLRSVTFVNELIDKAEAIGHSPMAYPARDELQKGLRLAIHESYPIFFRVTKKHVKATHIIHGARDLRRQFRRH